MPSERPGGSGRQEAAKHRGLRRQVGRADKRGPNEKSTSAMQGGAHCYPEPPFPRQHKTKPGQEARLDPPPMYEAPY
jgi:hypothetical protein